MYDILYPPIIISFTQCLPLKIIDYIVSTLYKMSMMSEEYWNITKTFIPIFYFKCMQIIADLNSFSFLKKFFVGINTYDNIIVMLHIIM
jgi:hypothetical protein